MCEQHYRKNNLEVIFSFQCHIWIFEKKLDWNRNVSEKFESLQSWIHFSICFRSIKGYTHSDYRIMLLFSMSNAPSLLYFILCFPFCGDSVLFFGLMNGRPIRLQREAEWTPRERTKTKRGAGPSLERTSLVFVLTLTLTVRVLRRLLVRPLL